MNRVYAEVGVSLQQIGGTCPDGWVVMQEERPTPEHVAQEDGSWFFDELTHLKEQAAVEVQLLMDSTAQTHGYDDIKSAVTYADEPAVPKFQAEGRAFRAWRSLCWDHCYTLLAQIESGDVTVPESMELFLAGLPQFDMEQLIALGEGK